MSVFSTSRTRCATSRGTPDQHSGRIERSGRSVVLGCGLCAHQRSFGRPGRLPRHLREGEASSGQLLFQPFHQCGLRRGLWRPELSRIGHEGQIGQPALHGEVGAVCCARHLADKCSTAGKAQGGETEWLPGCSPWNIEREPVVREGGPPNPEGEWKSVVVTDGQMPGESLFEHLMGPRPPVRGPGPVGGRRRGPGRRGIGLGERRPLRRAPALLVRYPDRRPLATRRCGRAWSGR